MANWRSGAQPELKRSSTGAATIAARCGLCAVKRSQMTMRMTQIAIVGALVLGAALYASKIIGNGPPAQNRVSALVAEAAPLNPQSGY